MLMLALALMLMLALALMLMLALALLHIVEICAPTFTPPPKYRIRLYLAYSNRAKI